ncbi:MAG: hypothetical protein KAJ75_00155 [Alphaproteobacteria bacterium]|nr:hypothetical protein [Alphaproteobacteria bacterium]
MAKGKVRKPKEQKITDLPFVDDEKFRKSFVVMFDKFDEKTRDKIRDTYQDRKLLQSYEDIRQSGLYQKAHGKAHHRKILEFPNREVFDFVDTIMTSKYGNDWLYDNRALKTELVKPWWVVKSL